MARRIRLRVDRRLGELSRELERSPKQRGMVRLPLKGKSKTTILASAGVSTSRAHRAEKIAAMPEC